MQGLGNACAGVLPKSRQSPNVRKTLAMFISLMGIEIHSPSFTSLVSIKGLLRAIELLELTFKSDKKSKEPLYRSVMQLG